MAGEHGVEQQSTMTDSKDHDLDRSLVGVIADAGALDLAAALAEGQLDKLLTDGPLKDVPFFGTLIRLWMSGPQVRDWLFMRKLGKFLVPIHQIPSEEREGFARKLDDDPEQRKRAGEHLMLVLERVDDFQKPELISRAFIAYLRGSYNFETFQRLSSAVERCFYTDLFRVAQTGKQVSYSQLTAINLSNAGLIELSAVPQIRAPEAKNQYSTTSLGETFRKVVLRQ